MTGLVICGILQLIIAVVHRQAPNAKATGKVTVGLTAIYMFSVRLCLSFALSVLHSLTLRVFI